ncbi:Ankyrin repeat protein 1 [Giardia muris]|uniref:Ankyrin repeat protein 1 n=1 Tax=Giardia muris TaxID=5742 RepID=A0A4Z1SPV2_GIAMU|nr:Ankyrin repeat protein 1 [Giardia muris]|eukprot:TNJ26905.1 Ankyrin repeat protein 1 [Giardia muris]
MLLSCRKDWFRAVLEHDIASVEESVSVYKRSRDGGGETALMLAARTNDARMVALLAPEEAGIVSPDGSTALMLAAARDYREVCEILGPFEGTQPNADGRTAGIVAAISGSTDALRVLSSTLFLRDNTGKDALEHAIAADQKESVKTILEVAPPKGEDLRSAIDAATAAGAKDIATLLTKHEETVRKPQRPRSQSVRFADEPLPSPCQSCICLKRETEMLRDELDAARRDANKHKARADMLESELAETTRYDREHQASLTSKCNSLEAELSILHEKYRVSVEEAGRLKLELTRAESTASANASVEHERVRNLEDSLASARAEIASLRDQLAHAREPEQYTRSPHGSMGGPRDRDATFQYELDFEKGSLMNSLPHSTPGRNGGQVGIKRSSISSSNHPPELRERPPSRGQGPGTTPGRGSLSRRAEDGTLMRASTAKTPTTRSASGRTAASTSGSGTGSNSGLGSTTPRQTANKRSNVRARASSLSARPSSAQAPTADRSFGRTTSIDRTLGHMDRTLGSMERGLSTLQSTMQGEPAKNGPASYKPPMERPPAAPVAHNQHHSVYDRMPSMSIAEDSLRESSPLRTSGCLDSTRTRTAGVSRLASHLDATSTLEGRPSTPAYPHGQKTELMLAAERNDIVSVWHRMNLQAGMRDATGTTALMYAVQAGNSAVARVLAEREAGMQRNDGSTALMDAACVGSLDCVRALLNKEAGMQRVDGWTALMTASSNNKPEIVKLLLDKEATLTTNARFTAGAGLTALMAASIEGHLEVVHLLVGAENGLRHSSGKTAADFAKNDSILKILRRY